MTEKKSECCEKCRNTVYGIPGIIKHTCKNPACPCHQPPEQPRQAGYLEIDHGSGLDWNNKPVTIDEIEKAVEANGGKFYYGEVGEEQSGDTVEEWEKSLNDL